MHEVSGESKCGGLGEAEGDAPMGAGGASERRPALEAMVASASAWRSTFFFFFQAEDGIRDLTVTGVQTCALPIWFPEIVYDVHQMGSNGVRLFVPPFQDPVNPNLDPAIVAGINLVGAQMAAALYDAGMTGIAHQQTYDLWWHGGFRSTPTRHNMIGILTEAASTRLGSPITLSLDSVRQPVRGVNYPEPWPGGTWHLGDIVRYELITSQALVRLAARDRVNVIDRFVGLGRRAVEAGLAGNPFAYVLPAEQRDRESWTALANVLAAAGVEVWRAAEPFSADGQTYAAG